MPVTFVADVHALVNTFDRALGNYVVVAIMALERLVVSNTGRTVERVNQFNALGRCDRHGDGELQE